MAPSLCKILPSTVLTELLHCLSNAGKPACTPATPQQEQAPVPGLHLLLFAGLVLPLRSLQKSM